MKKVLYAFALSALTVLPLTVKADVTELKVPLGAGGFGFYLCTS